MKIKGDHISIQSLDSDQLGNFNVIVGKNGSGKTQLINAIELFFNSRDSTQIYIEDSESISGCKKLDFTKILEETETSDESQLKYIIHGLDSVLYPKDTFSNSDSFGVNIYQLTKIIFEKKININTVDNNTLRIIHENSYVDDSYQEWLKATFMSSLSSKLLHLSFQYKEEDAALYLVNLLNHYKNHIKLVSDYIQKVNRHSIDNIQSHQVIEYLKSKGATFWGDVVNLELNSIFYKYCLKRNENYNKLILKIIHGRTNDAIDLVEYETTFPPPWNIFNSLLQKNNMSFYYKGLSVIEFNPYGIMTNNFAIYNKISDSIINYNNLSSGEQNLLAILSAVFKTTYYIHTNFEYGDVILLDEPDAHLHPEATKLLVDSLIDYVVNKAKIRVILTTHSPTTVALSPDDSLYYLTKNSTNTTLKKANKDVLLKELTEFIPTLSIDHKNHKQIITESPGDIFYYEAVYELLKNHLPKPHKSLYFIAGGTYGNSNCETVKTLCKSFLEAGNKSVYGIIDNDKNNKEAKNIFVHGLESRWCIENFLFDPIYLAYYLLSKDAHNIKKELQFGNHYSPFRIINEEQKRLQEICDWVIKKIKPNFKPNGNDELIKKQYLNGIIINIPKWYLLDNPNHKLEVVIKDTFSVFKGKDFAEPGAIPKIMSKVVVDCFPFLPLESVSLIERLTEVNIDQSKFSKLT